MPLVFVQSRHAFFTSSGIIEMLLGLKLFRESVTFQLFGNLWMIRGDKVVEHIQINAFLLPLLRQRVPKNSCCIAESLVVFRPCFEDTHDKFLFDAYILLRCGVHEGVGRRGHSTSSFCYRLHDLRLLALPYFSSRSPLQIGKKFLSLLHLLIEFISLLLDVAPEGSNIFHLGKFNR